MCEKVGILATCIDLVVNDNIWPPILLSFDFVVTALSALFAAVGGPSVEGCMATSWATWAASTATF